MRLRAWAGRDPAPLLIRFCAVAGLLFLLREQVSQVYLVAMAPLVNGLFQLSDLAAEYTRQEHVLELAYPALGLRFTVHDIVYQNLIVALALFAATPGSWRWRLKWMGTAVLVLWVTHVASLYMAGYAIVWDFVESLPAADREALAPQVAAQVSPAQDWLFSRLCGLWHRWGRPTAGLVIWLYAARNYLGFPRGGGVDRGQTPRDRGEGTAMAGGDSGETAARKG